MYSCVTILAVAIVAVTAQDDDGPTSKTGCMCVHYTLCNQTTMEIVDDGSLLLGSRVDVLPGCACPGPQNEFGENCGNRQMCCHLPGSPAKHATTTEEPDEESWEDCGLKGFRPDMTDERVIAGDDNGVTFSNEFPWMAMLLNKSDNSMVCGASILHHHVVMTAAHCVRRFQAHELLVRAGVWNTNDVTGSQTLAVDSIIKHEEFVARNFRNDVALLVLKGGLELAYNVGPICLPEPNTRYDNMVCTATGWGTSQFGTTAYSTLLKKVDLTIVAHAQCQNEMRKSRLGPWFKLHESFVCAKGENGVDTCTGDGGGPLVCRQSGSEKYVQVGITAAGVECGNNIPALYANIPRAVPWIEEKFNAGNLRNLQ